MSLIDLLSLPRLVNSGSLEGFIKYMGILASSSESQFASVVLGEIRINGKVKPRKFAKVCNFEALDLSCIY